MANVLIVDDDAALREGLAETLADLGHRPIAAPDGRIALNIAPMRVCGIIAQKSLPQHISGRRRIHRGTGVAGICLLHRVDRQHANGVDRQLIDIVLTCHSCVSLRPKSVEGGILSVWFI